MSRGATAGAVPAMDVVVDVVVDVARAVFVGTVVGLEVAGAVLVGLVPTEGGFHPRNVVPAHWPASRLLSRPHSL